MADTPEWTPAYARSCLIHLSDESPYRGQPEKYLDAVAEAIAEAAGNSFLVAFHNQRSLALRGEVVNPADRAQDS